MRAREATWLVLLVVTILAAKVLADDIYLEEPDGDKDEFLEVKEEVASPHFTRIKRNLGWWFPFSPTTTTAAPENLESITEDQDDTQDSNDYDSRSDGSGAVPVPSFDPDPREKTLRVSFVVMEPFLDDYSNRDSAMFQTFSHNLADAVNKLFEDQPGTQKASLVRIQSRPADSFSCKVTIDIVTTADNTDRLADKLRVHIRNTRTLGDYTLTDADFNAYVVMPGSSLEVCRSDELECNDGRCFPGSARCDGANDCYDGADEKDCPVDATNDQTEQKQFNTNQVDTSPPRCEKEIPCPRSVEITICPEDFCNGVENCPDGEDESPERCASTPSPDRGLDRGDQSLFNNFDTETTTNPPRNEETSRSYRPDVDETACLPGEFRCDETRCILNHKVCDQEADCSDGTDESACPPKSCGRDDFVCNNDQCIESYRRCDRVFDCPDHEDEIDCGCTSEEFECVSDRTCIESRKKCDGTPNCRDGSDEYDCACRINEWMCDKGNCIPRNKRCNGRVDCPTDRSDERNCVATGYFKCATGKVIPDVLRCNRRYDCPSGDYSDELNCPCGDNDFKCSNGHCIQSYKRCDRTHDCQDGSDEHNCNYGKECMAYEFKCTSGQCVPAASRCNGTVECEDESDENKCPCKRDQFRCQNGSCINMSLRCNFQNDCSQGEDEFNCANDSLSCPPDAYICPAGGSVTCARRCDNTIECDDGEDEEGCSDDECLTQECDGRCLDTELICDGKPDCADGSDERLCDKCEGPEDFRCDDGECIKLSERCNQVFECKDESDERLCNVTVSTQSVDCVDGQFRCRDGFCLNNEFACDGTPDCNDGSDEIGCPTARSARSQRPPCLDTEFTCYNGHCIPQERRCDNYYDCNDFSDEQRCESAPNQNFIPTTPAPVFTTTNREAYNPGGESTGYSPYAPRTDRPRTNDDSNYPPGGVDSNDPNSERNNVDYSETTYTPNNGYPPYDRNPSTEPPYNPYYNPNQYPGSNRNPPNNQNPSTEPPYNPYPSGSDPNQYPGSDNQSGGRYPYDSSSGQGGQGQPGDRNDQSGSRYPYDSSSGQGGQGQSGDRYDQSSSRYPYDSSSGQGGQPGDRNDQSGSSYPYDSSTNQGGRPGDRYDQSGSSYPYDSSTSQGGRPVDRYDQSGSRYPYDTSGQGGQPDNPDDNEISGYPSNGPSTLSPNYPRYPDSNTGSGNNYPVRGSSVACNRSQWRCENGPCIDARRRCDGHIDCPLDFSDEFDCPKGSPITLNLKSYPKDQNVRYGGDVVFICRDEGPLRAPVRWIREGGRPLKPGSSDKRGRLEMFTVSLADSGVYICQAPRYLGSAGSEIRVTLSVDRPQRFATTPTFVICKPFEATCSNGECIPKSAVCDGKVDCSDRSDEDTCNYNGKCEPNQFQCENRKCVLKSWLCDSDDDCGDGSDEKNCPALDPRANCLPVEFACSDKSQCIPKSFHCDGNNDCIDGSDEISCSPIFISQPPKPANLQLNPGDTLSLSCEAVGVPIPIISWRLNWGHVPEKCYSTNNFGKGTLTCPNILPEDSGAYSCEAINHKGTNFATPDAIVFVTQTSPCAEGYFNNEARSSSECIKCFCFGRAKRCHSADLFTYNMPTPLGEGGTRLLGVALSGDGAVRTDNSIVNHYYFSPIRNGATVTKLETRDPYWFGNYHPFLTLPESYNGNQLTSYGGYIKYKLQPHTYPVNDEIPSIIVKGQYATLYHVPRGDINGNETLVEARFLPEYWQKADSNGKLVPAYRQDIMMALDNVTMILIRGDNNNAGVNITDFVMESAQSLNSGLGAASLVEECSCPEGYTGLSCEKCKPGYIRQSSGPWLGICVRMSCPAGTYGDPSLGDACKPCPCPLTNKENQFATTCSLGSDGTVNCDCFPGYEGKNCEKCSNGFEGNPLIYGNKCVVRPTHNCNQMGTERVVQLMDECMCKDNVQGRFCDQCRNGSFYLSNDFRHGCALCFCSGESQLCMSSNLRRKKTEISFNVPSIVNEIKVYNILPQEGGNFRYTAPVETTLKPQLTRRGLGLSGLDDSQATVYYWSMPASFAGDKVTAYGGYLRYTLDNVPTFVGYTDKNKAADVQLISDNHLTFQYFGDFNPTNDVLNVSVQLLEKGWQRSDGKEIPRELFLLGLADVKTILIKASYAREVIATPIYASIDTAAADGDGPAALHVEQCVCPPGYVGTSCEDCAPGFTRGTGGFYLAHCEECQCNGHSRNCHPENGECYECLDNTMGPHCELCKPGYEPDGYENCRAIDNPSTTQPCRCDARGEAEPCDAYGQCTCKQNVDGENCDRCRAGTFGLDIDNPVGCSPCYCSGATTECQEANIMYRAAIPAPILGDNYGGYTVMDFNGKTVVNDHFVPVPDKSELMYIFPFPADTGMDLYWSLPVFPGNRILSYGGSLSLRQEFKSNDYNDKSTAENHVILIGDDMSLTWNNPNTLQSGVALSYQVPLSEKGWTILNTAEPVTRPIFMRVLKNLRRVLVKATLAPNIVSTSIADVSMDTATEIFQPNAQLAKNIEMCMCPPGHLGTSCESCVAGYYKDRQDYCTQCPCHGHDCQLDTYGQVMCNCQPPHTGRDCSEIGLLMELHPTLQEVNDPSFKQVTLTCKYRAPEQLTIKFVVEGKDLGTIKWYNESTLNPDGWHGEHTVKTLWDTKEDGKIYECETITQRGSIIGVLFADMRSAVKEGDSQTNPVTTNRPPLEPSTITVKITSEKIAIREVGSSVNFTCEARSTFTRRLVMNWTKVDGELPLDRAFVDPYSGLLTISNLQLSDSGQYVCQSSDGRSTQQEYATLKVPANRMTLPIVEIRPGPVSEIFVGDRVELQCVATGSPKPTVSWQRAARRPLPLTAQIYGNIFLIESARAEDSGEYRCIASNTLGISDGFAVINIRSRPARPKVDRLVVSPESPTVNEGQTIRVVCTGSVNVRTGSLDWVRQDQDRFGDNVRSDNGVLYIEEARPENAGVYVCQTDSSDVAPEPILLNVVSTATQSPDQAPSVHVPVNNVKIPSGSSHKVDCYPRGQPLPLIRWSRYEGHFGPGVSQRDNSLILNEVQETDAGYYQCQGVDLTDNRVVNEVYVYVEVEKREAPLVEIWPPGEQPVALGNTSFEFHCRVLKGIPSPAVTWSRGSGRELSRHAQILPNNILRFSQIEVNDEGEYICTGDNSVGSSSGSAVIKVRSPPEMTITPTDYLIVIKGDPVAVDCRADGYPEPAVVIKGPDHNDIVSGSRIASLRIASASTRDEGEYSCVATNAAGTNTEVFLVHIEDDRGDGGADFGGSGDFNIDPDSQNNQYTVPTPVHNPRFPFERTYIEGAEADIECKVVPSSLSPQWIRGDERPMQPNVQQINNRLFIRNITKADSGVYVCSGYNLQTGTSSTALYTNIRVVSKPKITLHPKSQVVQPGNSPTVECIVEGDDLVEILWRPTNKPFSRRVRVKNATLIFQQIETEDAGLYQCIARSLFASASATAEVKVVEESDLGRVSHEHEQWVQAGSGVVLSCNISMPGVTVYWTKDGNIPPTSVIAKQDGSLYIKLAQRSHSGQYVCRIQDTHGRQTSNYINLHIEGAPAEKLVEIDQPRRAFRAGENVNVLCKSTASDVDVEWIKRDDQGQRQYVDSFTYGDGSMLRISSVGEDDIGLYQCTGQNRYGLNYTDNFNLDIVPGSAVTLAPEPNFPVREYTARLRQAIDMPCYHNMEGEVTVHWKREYVPLPPHIRNNQPILHIESVNEGHAGTYVCRISNGRHSIETKAILRVIGIIPSFDGESWIALPALKEAYRQFDIEISFKPMGNSGLILYNSQNPGRSTDFLSLQLIEGIPEFTLETGSGPVSVTGNQALAANKWHTIRLNKLGSRVTMDVDNDGPFVVITSENWVLELNEPLYIGGVPDYNQLPSQIAGTEGFIGCVSMLILGHQEKNIMMDRLDEYRVQNCDTCVANLCENDGVCQESRTERGYTCLCPPEYAGTNCERRGEGCRPGICGPGRCSNTADGYKCACPATHNGPKCENRQQIEYPAFTGQAYVALKPPNTARFFKMSMKIKATAPVSDGIILYCAESPRGIGGFTSLAVKYQRLEFRFELGEGNPAILVSNETLPADEWTDVQVTRSGPTVSLIINLVHNFEKRLDSTKSLKLETPMFVGGVDDSIVVNSNVGITSGFMGCIKDLKTQGSPIDLVKDPNVESANLKECSNFSPRGDIPAEADNTCHCNNGGTCAADGTCVCPAGFSGYYCETRLASSLRHPQPPPTDPCAVQPCRNGGYCRPDYTASTLMNHTCDCPLGYSGASCQMRLELLNSVGFNGNGYLELPHDLVDYEDMARRPAIIMVRIITSKDGVLVYQREMNTQPDNGDFLMIRIERGLVVLEFDMGAGPVATTNSAFIGDGEMHIIIVRLLGDGRVELDVDGEVERAYSNGFANRMNADSNIYIGGIPKRLNVEHYPGFTGCIDQVEFMDTSRGVDLGHTAVAGRNTQPCRY